MAYDDDEDMRWRRAELEAEKARRLWKARREGDDDTQRILLGIPLAPAPSPSADWEAPEPPEDGVSVPPWLKFRQHKRALLNHLESGTTNLSPMLLGSWAARVERLDFDRAKEGLAEIRAIAEEFNRATGREHSMAAPAPHARRNSDDGIIGIEIEWLDLLLYTALAPR